MGQKQCLTLGAESLKKEQILYAHVILLTHYILLKYNYYQQNSCIPRTSLRAPSVMIATRGQDAGDSASHL